MKEESATNSISAESLAAFLDGNATAEETRAILRNLAEDDELSELMRISQSVDNELAATQPFANIIPMAALAATCSDSACCCLECEKYILRKRGIDHDAQQLLSDARQQGSVHAFFTNS